MWWGYVAKNCFTLLLLPMGVSVASCGTRSDGNRICLDMGTFIGALIVFLVGVTPLIVYGAKISFRSRWRNRQYPLGPHAASRNPADPYGNGPPWRPEVGQPWTPRPPLHHRVAHQQSASWPPVDVGRDPLPTMYGPTPINTMQFGQGLPSGTNQFKLMRIELIDTWADLETFVPQSLRGQSDEERAKQTDEWIATNCHIPRWVITKSRRARNRATHKRSQIGLDEVGKALSVAQSALAKIGHRPVN